MMTIGERLKFLRKEELNKTQQEFADRLNLSRSNLGNIETGRVEITERTIADICREFDVNEPWLRTGEGEIFKKRTRDQEISDFIGNVLSKENDTFKKRLISVLSSLDEDEWEVLEMRLKKIVGVLGSDEQEKNKD